MTNLGELIKIQWIPSHIIPENNIADKMAKMACDWQTISEFLPECEENVSNLRREMQSYRLDNWEQTKSSLKLGDYINNIFDWKWVTSGLRRCDVIMARFRNGCVGLNEYLFKLGFVIAPYCEYCPGYQIEDANHFILLCPKYEEYREDLRESLKKLGIGVNPLQLADLLGGSGFTPHRRRRIMLCFYKFIVSSGKLTTL